MFSDFVHAVPLVLDGGACGVGIESTIVDFSGEHARLLRPGGVAAAAIEESLGEPLAPADDSAPRAPGTHASHYAPRAQVKLVRRIEMLETLSSTRAGASACSRSRSRCRG